MPLKLLDDSCEECVVDETMLLLEEALYGGAMPEINLNEVNPSILPSIGYPELEEVELPDHLRPRGSAEREAEDLDVLLNKP